LARNSIIKPYAQIAHARNLSLWRAKQAHNFAESGAIRSALFKDWDCAVFETTLAGFCPVIDVERSGLRGECPGSNY
jgi:hypothetical protein